MFLGREFQTLLDGFIEGFDKGLLTCRMSLGTKG